MLCLWIQTYYEGKGVEWQSNLAILDDLPIQIHLLMWIRSLEMISRMNQGFLDDEIGHQSPK